MTVQGEDLYEFNPFPNTPSKDFYFLKATEGVTFRDPTYQARAAAVRAAGKVLGAYHYWHYADSEFEQVSVFAQHAQLLPGDVGILDFEDDGTWHTLTAGAIATRGTLTMNQMRHAFPYNRLLLYCNETTFYTIVQPFNVPQGDGLWIAHPGGRPTMPFLFWQYGQTGVDLDEGEFSTPADLHLWAGTQHTTDWMTEIMGRLPTLSDGWNDQANHSHACHNLQAMLNVDGFGLAVDGAFGPHTNTAVRGFQRDSHLAQDGVVGPHTWSVLLTGLDL
jgi:hypothetical protein